VIYFDQGVFLAASTFWNGLRGAGKERSHSLLKLAPPNSPLAPPAAFRAFFLPFSDNALLCYLCPSS